MRKARKKYPEDFKTMFGLSTMGWTSVVGQSFLSSLFMIYLTDYSGIEGKISAAELGTFLLVIGRLIDAFDDPLQGWIMDNARRTRLGKYKLFCFISILLITVSVVMLFGIPKVVIKNTTMTVAWFVIFYLMYDIGSSFYADGPLKQTLSGDDNTRSKLIMWPRISCFLITIPGAFIFTFLNGIDHKINDLHTSFAVMTLIIMIPIAIISIIGLLQVKEGKTAEVKFRQPRISFRDILIMLKTNRPFLISQLATLSGGLIWVMVMATTTYYVKWAFCANHLTGVVDEAKFAQYTVILGTLQVIPMLISTLISSKLIRMIGSPIKTIRVAYIIMGSAGFATYLLNQFGLLQDNAFLYFLMITLLLFGNGLTFVPGNMIGLECMDYAMWKTGKASNGIISTLSNFIQKAQTAVGSMAVGIVLVLFGYHVNPSQNVFTGEMYNISNMLNAFIIISGLIPAVLAVITIGIYYLYPLDEKVRNKMKEDLIERKANIIK